MTAALLAVALADASPAQTARTEVRAEHVVVRGALDTNRLQPVACDAQQALRIVGAARESAPELSIIAAANEGQMWEVLPHFWERRGRRPLGGYWTGVYGHHIAVRVDAPTEERLRRMLHEVAHFATHMTLGEPPRWLDEGLSELWEHTAIGNGHIEVGRPVERHLRALRADKNWIPVAKLAAASDVLDERSGASAAMFYAQSWALVHYLLLEKGGGTLALARLPAAGDLPADDELRAYARGKLASPVRIPASTAAACDGPFETRSLTEPEAMLLRARALADGERPDAALPLLKERLRQEPNSPEALETLGFVHFRGNRLKESAAAFDRVIAAGRGSHIAYFYRAMLAGPIPVRSDGSGSVPELDYLREAVRLKPGFRPASDRLCELQGKQSDCVPASAVPH